MPDNDFLFVWNSHRRLRTDGESSQRCWRKRATREVEEAPLEFLEGEWRRRPKIQTTGVSCHSCRAMHRATVGEDHWIECYQDMAARFVMGNWPFDSEESLEMHKADVAKAINWLLRKRSAKRN